jgi:gamma-glutamyltranspeptidase/glutathione hydrolase
VRPPVKPLLAGVALAVLAGWPALAVPPFLPQLGESRAAPRRAGGQAGNQESGEAAANVLQERQQRFQPVWSARGMVAAGEPLAAQAGARLLAAGGNAVDAAVATSFALAVTLPHSTGIGGGGFLLLWLPGTSPAASPAAASAGSPAASWARSGACAAARAQELPLGRGFALGIDFRESAPAASAGNLFLDGGGAVDRRRATTSLLSTAVPGTVAGLLLAQRCYGRLPLERVLAPAIALAGDGVPVSRAS